MLKTTRPRVELALEDLELKLGESLREFNLPGTRFGDPELIERTAVAIERATHGSPIGKPTLQDSAVLAERFVRGEALDEDDDAQLAWALCLPVASCDGRQVIGAGARFNTLLARYREAARSDELWRLSWLGLLSSYFAYRASGGEGGAADPVAQEAWQRLRAMLQETWPLIRARPGFAPDWVKALDAEPRLLSPDPCAVFAADYLAGDDENIRRFEHDLGIPETSWFWHRLVLAAVEHAVTQSDELFKASIERIVGLIRAHPAFRDEVIELLLERYHRCKERPVPADLRDYVIDSEVWRNPKLKSSGAAPAWNRVSEEVWQMVLGWVNQVNVRLFFDVLAGRNDAAQGRYEFWSRYASQIIWTRLAIGADTLKSARQDAGLANLITLEYGSFAMLEARWRAVDAIMMQIGDFLVVEYSVNSESCYVYPLDNLPFDRHAKILSGGSGGLKAGYYHRGETRDLRIEHSLGWPERAAAELSRIGIRPDRIAPDQVRPIASRRPIAESEDTLIAQAA